MLPELLEFVDESVLQLVERGENHIGESLAQMAKDLRGLVQFWTCRVADRADACPVASSPRRCDDCPNCPARPQSHPLPTPDANAAGRSPGIGHLRWAVRERRLYQWWVLPLHTATRSRLARERRGRFPKGHQRLRSQLIRPKRPSSMATTRLNAGGFTRLPKFFYKRLVARHWLSGVVCAQSST